MEVELVSETLVYLNYQMLLSARKEFIKFDGNESFKTYINHIEYILEYTLWILIGNRPHTSGYIYKF